LPRSGTRGTIATMAKAPTSITWIVRYVEDGVFKMRTFQTEEAARGFMQRTLVAGGDVRSWAEVWTHEREVPTLPGQP
jgi:hypothetical protein